MNTRLEDMPAVAVIGMAGRFPGAADVVAFWDNLRSGTESISVFSEDEMAAAGVDLAGVRGANYVPSRGVAPDLDLFDATFFGFTPREAELMDPQHRVFLETAWEALEDAGIDPDRYQGAIGVYAGTSISTYLINNVVPRMGGLGAGAIQFALANDKDHVPTRVSYKLNLRGPSVNVQTACSTSLVAIHMACQSILSGECDVSLAGGVSVTVPLKAGYHYEEGSILSPDGHCRAFDAASEGTVGGSGVAIVVLKLLERALEDRDAIHAVVRGSAINNDGSFKVGYTAPSVEGQAEVIAQAQGVAEVAPDTISYVEAHGTATPLGDPIEIEALTRAFREQTDRSGFCAIGSVKTNIGHMDAAAGAAGLIKTVLALRHAEIPPSLHFSAPNPEIDFQSTPFFVNARLTPWDTGKAPRRAGVSSFGIGGTNAHVVLEQAPELVPGSPSRTHQLLTLSARTDIALKNSATRLADHLDRFSDLSLADVAHTLQVGRRAFGRRVTVVAQDDESAVSALRSIGESKAAAIPDRPVVFMFPGQGSQHVGMGRSLYESEPTFTMHMDECFDLLEPLLGLELRNIIYPSGAGGQDASDRLTDTRFAQPAIFALQYSLARLWIDWGVRPQCMIGHSIGEYAAACIGGVLNLQDALRLVAARGRLMAEQQPGSMLAVPLPSDEVADFLRDGVSLAAVNQVGLSVLSGPTPAIEALAAELSGRGIEGKLLQTSHAFHSSMMDPALAPFEAEVDLVDLHPPDIPFVSCVTGRDMRSEDAVDPGYWARHMREPVLFAKGLDSLLASFPEALLLEVGSSQTLSGLVRRHASSPTAVSSLPHALADESDSRAAIRALGAVWASGASVDWSAFCRRESRRKVSLPTYPFQRLRYWIDAGDARWTPDRIDDEGKVANVADWFYVPTWHYDVRQATRTSEPEPPRCWLLFGAEVAPAGRIARFLEERGCEVVPVSIGTDFREEAGGFVIDPSKPGHYASLLDALETSDRTPDVMLHAWSGRPRPAGEGHSWAEEVVADELNLGVHSLIGLAHALAHRDWVAPLRVAALTVGAVDTSGDSPPLPFRAAALGALKVIPQELPHVTAVGVDIDEGGGLSWRDADLAGVVADVCMPSPPATVAYRGRRRFAERHERVSGEADSGTSLLRENGVYMILGGLGGVGVEVARHLHRLCGARLILTTTRAIQRGADGHWHAMEDSGDGALAQVNALQAEGAELLLIQSDVTDVSALEAAFAAAERTFGVVHGVVFAAGVSKSPTPIVDADRSEIDAQLNTRIRGLGALGRAARLRDLDFCLIQSSLASVLGAAGFVGYAAAHAFMDAFAAEQDRKGPVPWIAVDWDNWITWKDADSGIEEAAEFFMSPEEGGQALEIALSLGLSHQRLIVSTGALERRLRRWINPSGSPDAQPTIDGSVAARYARPDTGEPYEPPTSESERVLAEIWGEILGIEPVGINDDFFELGGDSVLGIQVVAKSRRAGLRLSAQEIFQYPTIAQLAEAATNTSAAVDAEQGMVAGPVPLTPIQRWFFERDFPEPHHFNMPVLLEAAGDVDLGRLSETVEMLLRHHDALRMRYDPSDDGWHQYVEADEPSVEVTVIDLSAAAPDELSVELARAAAPLQSSLDLSVGPMVRVALVRMGKGSPDRVLLVVHHLVVDAVSWRVLLEDFDTVYRFLGEDDGLALPPKTTSFQKWAEAVQDHANSDALAAEVSLWTESSERAIPALPQDLEAGPNDMGSMASVFGSLGEEHTRSLLQDVPKRLSAKIEEVLLSALVSTITAWTGERHVRIALEGHGREDIAPDLDTSRTVGWFTTLFPVLIDVDKPGSPDAAIRAVKEQYRPIPKGGIGYGLLRYMSLGGVGGAFERVQEPEISFLYLGRYREDSSGDHAFRVVRDPSGPACDPRVERPHLFDAVVSVIGGRLEVEIGYCTNRHDSTTAERLVSGFIDVLQTLVTRDSDGAEGVVLASDFPDSGLTQEQLEALISGMSEETE